MKKLLPIFALILLFSCGEDPPDDPLDAIDPDVHAGITKEDMHLVIIESLYEPEMDCFTNEDESICKAYSTNYLIPVDMGNDTLVLNLMYTGHASWVRNIESLHDSLQVTEYPVVEGSLINEDLEWSASTEYFEYVTDTALFSPGDPRYIGMRITNGDSIHYGWLEYFDTDIRSVYLMKYAYEE